MKPNIVISIAAAVSLLTGCAAGPSPYPANPNVAGNSYGGYGVVETIERVPENNGIAGSGIGLGTVAGAVIGGVLGNQIGSGRGNTAATVAGAAGGAYVGHQMENRQRTDEQRITVRMRDGSLQTVTAGSGADFRVGDRVRFENGALQRY